MTVFIAFDNTIQRQMQAVIQTFLFAKTRPTLKLAAICDKFRVYEKY